MASHDERCNCSALELARRSGRGIGGAPVYGGLGSGGFGIGGLGSGGLGSGGLGFGGLGSGGLGGFPEPTRATDANYEVLMQKFRALASVVQELATAQSRDDLARIVAALSN